MSATKQLWLWAISLPLFLFVAETMCIWRGPQILGLVAMFFLTAFDFAVLIALVAVPACPSLLAIGLLQWRQPGRLLQGISRASACFCLVAFSLFAFYLAHQWRHEAFVRAAQIGDQVVNALGRYHRDKGAYPESLDQLVPDYLPTIPYTGLVGYPRYAYRPGYLDIAAKPGEYELRIDCTVGGINFDRFIYWPTEEYPERIQGNGVEPIGRWAYIHE